MIAFTKEEELIVLVVSGVVKGEKSALNVMEGTIAEDDEVYFRGMMSVIADKCIAQTKERMREV